MSKEFVIGDAWPTATAKAAQTVPLVACVIVLSFIVAIVNVRPQRFHTRLSEETLAELNRLERRFHDCYAIWQPDQGVRSPCPKLQDQTNISLLNLLGLQMAHPSEVVRIVGPPEAVYENGRHPGVYYWRLKHYWATTAPCCVMLLPRNPQFDAMMRMALKQDNTQPVPLDQPLSITSPVDADGESSNPPDTPPSG